MQQLMVALVLAVLVVLVLVLVLVVVVVIVGLCAMLQCHKVGLAG